MRRWLIALLALAVVVGAGWAIGSPYFVLWQMKKAAEARDLASLSSHIDYPAVRSSLKAQLANEVSDRKASLFGVLVASGIADAAVDTAVTPEGMRLIFAAAPLASSVEPEPQSQPLRLKADEMAYRRTGWDRFSLVRRDGSGAGLDFALHGLSWQLVAVRIPPGALH